MQFDESPGSAASVPPAPDGYALALSGGGVRATAFHLGLLLRLAVDEKLERVTVLSTVSGGSLAAGLVFSNSALTWPTSASYITDVLPRTMNALVDRSLQGGLLRRVAVRPWTLFQSRGDLFAAAIQEIWGVGGTLKELCLRPQWFINATCYDTGRNWRFSQRHIGDWVFGHNFTQSVKIATAIAASAAIPYIAGFVKLPVQPNGWFKINPATDEPQGLVEPLRNVVRLWDGGVYENLGMEAIYKPQRGLVSSATGSIIVGDASAHLAQHFGPAGIFMRRYPYIRPPRLFDIATEQTRALRSRMLVEALSAGRVRGAIVRLGRSVRYIDAQAGRRRSFEAQDSFLDSSEVSLAATYPTNAHRMSVCDFGRLVRHGFETADATLTAYMPDEFGHSILWSDIKEKLPTRLHV